MGFEGIKKVNGYLSVGLLTSSVLEQLRLFLLLIECFLYQSMYGLVYCEKIIDVFYVLREVEKVFCHNWLGCPKLINCI